MRIPCPCVCGHAVPLPAWGLLFLWALAIAAGCGNGETRIVVRKPATARPDIDPAAVSKGTLSVPAATQFNYTSFKSGQTGTGRGRAEAVGSDGATCGAEASDGSTAWGQFLLGYCFDNVTDTPLRAVVKLRLRASQSIWAEPANSILTDNATTAKTHLEFFIKDTNGQVLKSEDLLANSLETGPNASSAEHDLAFDARFEPARGYYLMVVGRTEVEAGPGESVTASIGVTGFELEIAWQGLAAAVAEAPASPQSPGPARGHDHDAATVP